MSNYVLELSVIHIALILGYWFFLRKERQYSKMRFYLIGATLLALVIPFLKLPKLLFYTAESPDAIRMGAIQLDAMTISASPEISTWSYDLLIGAYLVISAVFLFRFLGGVVYLVWLGRKSRLEEFNGLSIRKADNIKGSFTFFNWIFLSSEIDPNQQDYKMILNHERAHASLGHTYDLIFFELFKVCFWWLPTAWIVIKQIKKIHEYQADAAALKSCDVDQYLSVLISSTLEKNGVRLASSFHDGLILKRLTAMKQQAKNVSPWKLAALSVLCASLIIVFACSEEADREIKEMGSKSNMITFDQLPPSMQADLANIQGELSFLKIDVPADEQLDKVVALQDLDPKLIHTVNVDKPNRVIYLAVKKDGANFDYLSNKSKMAGEVFTVVEKQPEYNGGIQAFRRFLAHEMRYPLAARQAGIEGRVEVQFVVEKDGSLSEVKAVKGIGAGCDEEAVRVVQSMPSFQPGMQNGRPVRVRMVVPIAFKLNEGKTNPDNSTQGMIIIEDVEARYETMKVSANYANGEWSGTIRDQAGKALPGANIIVYGTTNGTVSGPDGTFRLKAEPARDLVISFIGYETATLKGQK